MGIEAHGRFDVAQRLLGAPNKNQDGGEESVAVGVVGVEGDRFAQAGDGAIAVE